MLNYSIIIPHRDIPQLLQRCLDSIPQRPDLEVIVVDDNSNPEVVDFDHFPGMGRPDTTVIFDKSGMGAGRARNIGLEYAKGKWLLFADADDFFNYCLNDVLDEYADNDADIIFFKASCVDSQSYLKADRTDEYNYHVKEYENTPMTSEIFLRYVAGVPWAKLVRHEIVTKWDIHFQETLIFNDTKFSYLTGYYAKEIAVDQRAVYCLTYRPDSISYTLTDEKIIDRTKVHAERERFYLDHDIPCAFKYMNYVIDTLIQVREQGKTLLFEKCFEILSEFGFSREMMLGMISKELQRRQRLEKRKSVNEWIGRVKNAVGHPFRIIIYRLAGI